jgi:hypothetical protein
MSLTAELATTVRKSKTAWRELVHETARTGIEPPLAAIEHAGGSGDPAALVERFRSDVDLAVEFAMARAAEEAHLSRMRQIAAAGDPAAAVKAAEAALLEAKSRLALYHSSIEAAAYPGRKANHLARTRPDLFDEAGG